jgi:NADP-dependent 3-hydroxy acid dehydrogenase YdfG
MVAGFIARGHTVIGCGRSREGIAELRSSYPETHRFDVVDVTSDSAVASWAKDVESAGLEPDLICNNAAAMNEPAPLWKIPAAEFDGLIDVNIKGVGNVMRHFLPGMVARRKGVVVNFSSGWGRSTSANVAPYCATKWAIEGLSQACAAEVPAGVAVIALNPGIINTEMLRKCFAGAAENYPAAEEWAERAVPAILRFTARENGRSASIGQ